MKKLSAVTVLLTLALGILSCVSVRVNSRSVNVAMVAAADGSGSPVPSFPR
jgi:hypothetical protein